MSSTVTLDKAYFETLLRKAQFHTSGHDFTTPINIPTVTIPKLDHDRLVRSPTPIMVTNTLTLRKLTSSREYANLKRNLFRGGIADETFNILIKDDAPSQEPDASTTYSTAEDSSTHQTFVTQFPASISRGTTRGFDYTYGRNASYSHFTSSNGMKANGHNHSLSTASNGYPQPKKWSDELHYEETIETDSLSTSRRQKYEKHCQRTILLTNLPEGVTHAEVVSVIKGGMLLDVYVRSQDKAASISFLHETTAQKFYSHVQRHDLYLKGKRLGIRWSDRQHILPGHVANQIASGATRNLVIINKAAKHTETAIRDDLEHIHNLVIINVSFKQNNVCISTNSVYNAMFARTCMMSRAVYKGSTIAWGIDECDVPLANTAQKLQAHVPQTKKENAVLNRFHVLSLDNTDNESQDEGDSERLPSLTASDGSTIGV